MVAYPLAHTRIVKRIDIMQAPAPDLTPQFESTPSRDNAHRDDNDEAHAEAAQLEQLADRVSAARSVF